MKTTKRSFWWTLALVAVCVCAAAVFAGCDETPPAPHEHSYTEWHYSDTEHWRECPDDGAATEKSKHKFVDGKCECGLVDTREFGTVTGKIALRGGKAPNDYGGVTVDFDGDDVNVSIDENGNFTAAHVTVGKDYNVTVSKEGYHSYTAFVGLDEKDQTVAIAKPFTLEYKRFDYWMGYNKDEHDFSKVNDAQPEIGNNGKTLNVITRDTYSDVAVSLWIKKGNSRHIQDVQGVFVKFEGDKYAILGSEQICTGNPAVGTGEYKLQWMANLWDNSTFNGQKSDVVHPLTSDQNTSFEGDNGLKVTLLRRGGTLYTYVNGGLVIEGTMTLPAEYSDDKAQVGLFAYDSKENATWKFDIEEDISEYEALVEDFAAPTVTAENGTVSFDKSSYKYGECATITVTPADGYVLGRLDVNGKSVSAEVENNVYSFAVTGDINVTATFIPSTQFDSVIFTTPAVANANDLQITLSRDGETDKVGTVANDMFTATDVKPGLWHAKTSQYGVEVALKDVFVGAETVELDMSGVFESASAVNFGNEKTYSGGDATFYTVPANISGDAYFGMKLKCATDITTAKNDSIQFGLQLFYEGQGEASMRLTVKNNADNNGGYYKMQQSNLWDEENVAETYVNALKNDGLYVVVYREAATGNVYAYYGTSKNNIVKSNKVYGSGDKKKGNIIKFGAGFWGGNYSATIGDLRYGTTIAEALGEQVTPVTVTGTGDVMDGQKKQGDIAVANAYVYEDVTVTITEAAGYKLSGFTVNGASIPLTSLTANGNGTYSYKIGCYTSNALSVGATFVDYLVRDVAVTVSGHKVGENVQLNGEVTLTNAADSSDVHKATLTDGTVTVTGLVTPATYKVTFDTANYYEGEIELQKGDTIASVSLEYKRFDLWAGYNKAEHDFSHVNDDEPTIGNNGKTLNVITHDMYDEVAVSLWIKQGNGTNHDLQGIFVEFTDGKCVKAAYAKDGWVDNGLMWFAATDWGKTPIYTDKKIVLAPFSDTQNSLLTGDDGLKVTLLRKDRMVYIFANDVLIGASAMTLPAEYADDMVKVGFFTFGSRANAVWKFDIEKNIASYVIPNFTVPTVSATNGTVRFDKDSYDYGETATVTVTPDSDYILGTLTVCGNDVTSQVSNNAYSFTVTQDITVSATFKEYLLSNVELTVSGHKAGENVKLNGEVTLTNAADSNDVRKVTLTDGTVTVQNMVTPATYKVTFDTANYNEGTIKLEKGDTTASVSLEYKRFDLWVGWDGAQHDMSKVNDENPTIGNDGNTLNVISRDNYDDVAVSLWFKDGNSTYSEGNNSGVQGMFFKYADGKYMFLRLLRNETDNNKHRLQWSPDFNGNGKWTNDFGNLNSVIPHGWVEFGNGTYENELNSAEGLKVTLVRKGNMIYTMVNDVSVPRMTMALPVEYAGNKVQFGFFAYNSKANATWKFEITEPSGAYGSEIYQDHNGTEYVNSVNLSGESVSFVAKFKMDATTEKDKRISIDMKFKDRSEWAAMGFCTNTDGSVKFQAINIWNLPEHTLTSDEKDALTGDGLYLAVTVDTTRGTVTAYIGTDKQKLKQISTKTDDAYKHSIERTGVRLASGVKSSGAEFAYGNSLSAIKCTVVNA